MRTGRSAGWARGSWRSFTSRCSIISTHPSSASAVTTYRCRSITTWNFRCSRASRKSSRPSTRSSDMPSEITMPQLSDTMTEGTVVKWLKKEGDKVKEGEIIAEVETDKATMEYESPEAGTIAVIRAKEGDKVKVGD